MKFRKQLDIIKQKYEKDDIYLDVEKFFSEEDEEGEENNQNKEEGELGAGDVKIEIQEEAM